MDTATAYVLVLLVLGYAVISGVVRRWYVAPAVIFIAFGMVLGPYGFGAIDVGRGTAGFTVLAQLALTMILFNQAAELDLSAALRRGRLAFRLIVVGIPLTLALGTLTAVVLLPVLPLWEALCLAAIVAPTEVALIDALLADKRIPERVRHVMSVESGCYDGFALTALLAALALASESNDDDAARWALFLVRTELLSLALGLAIGVAGGYVVAQARRRGWMLGPWAQLSTMAIALVCFASGERLHASGFVTAFAGGIGYAWIARRIGATVPTAFSDTVGQLLELLVFAMFGGYAVIAGWHESGAGVVAFGVLAMVVRLVAVLVAFWRTDLPMRSRVFVGWFGPRGIGSLVLGLVVLDRGVLQQAEVITQAVAVVVTVSLVLDSITAPLGIRWVSRDRLTPRRLAGPGGSGVRGAGDPLP